MILNRYQLPPGKGVDIDETGGQISSAGKKSRPKGK